jgi:hypothetical protein
MKKSKQPPRKPPEAEKDLDKCHHRPARYFRIRQKHWRRGRHMITGIPIGGSGHFTATPIFAPPNVLGSLQPGNVPTWTADDANVAITPAADGLSAVISVAAGDTGTSFNLTVSGVNSANSPISTSVSVPILPAPPPPPATGFDIEQTV